MNNINDLNRTFIHVIYILIQITFKYISHSIEIYSMSKPHLHMPKWSCIVNIVCFAAVSWDWLAQVGIAHDMYTYEIHRKILDYEELGVRTWFRTIWIYIHGSYFPFTKYKIVLFFQFQWIDSWDSPHLCVCCLAPLITRQHRHTKNLRHHGISINQGQFILGRSHTLSWHYRH